MEHYETKTDLIPTKQKRSHTYSTSIQANRFNSLQVAYSEKDNSMLNVNIVTNLQFHEMAKHAKRLESSVLQEHVEAQAKELNQRMHRIKELEEERIANESVERLMMDIAVAEEEINKFYQDSFKAP
ncbi:hypothetical protein GOBAR_AA17871 [Gossypium barbadense]|uniref:Uncharacterized protein n=1 Tax=Gossypium barbadense TaxID=3634 RepID=A0A2P5XHJ5_GOSBA|nr:hypothetical protein GOBAR_AA17871 [Gossypium barbadense]